MLKIKNIQSIVYTFTHMHISKNITLTFEYIYVGIDF